jgi:cell division protein FtsB
MLDNLAHANFTITQMDARITDLVARLTALDRERAEIMAEINTLRSARNEETAAIKGGPLG